MTTRNDWRISLAAAVAASLFMAGCGSSGGGGGIDSPAAGAPPADAASGETPPVEERLFTLPSSFRSLARALGLLNAQISSSPTDHVPASRKNQIGHALVHGAAGRDPGAAITPLEFSRKHPTDADHRRALTVDTHLSYDALNYYLASRGARYTGGVWRIQSPRQSTTVTVSTDSGTTQSARKRITTGPADRRNRTEEHVATAMGRDSSGNNTYRVEYIYPRADARPGPWGLAWWILDSAESGTATTRWTGAAGRHGAFMVRGNIWTANIENSTAFRSGTAWTAVSTDYSSTRQTDWLAIGLWGYRNDTAGATEQFGVFADGGEPFATPLLIGATGSATYRGRALGMYARPTGSGSNMATDFFTANATLEADFDNHPGSAGTSANRGSLQGHIDNFRIGTTPVAGNPVIKLLTTTVGGSWDGVQFRDAATLTHGGRSHSGHWGGQFYGIPETGNQPEAVAGTFGVNSGSATGTHSSFVGAFDARR